MAKDCNIIKVRFCPTHQKQFRQKQKQVMEMKVEAIEKVMTELEYLDFDHKTQNELAKLNMQYISLQEDLFQPLQVYLHQLHVYTQELLLEQRLQGPEGPLQDRVQLQYERKRLNEHYEALKPQRKHLSRQESAVEHLLIELEEQTELRKPIIPHEQTQQNQDDQEQQLEDLKLRQNQLQDSLDDIDIQFEELKYRGNRLLFIISDLRKLQQHEPLDLYRQHLQLRQQRLKLGKEHVQLRQEQLRLRDQQLQQEEIMQRQPQDHLQLREKMQLQNKQLNEQYQSIVFHEEQLKRQREQLQQQIINCTKPLAQNSSRTLTSSIWSSLTGTIFKIYNTFNFYLNSSNTYNASD